jgi:hypothetical protein
MASREIIITLIGETMITSVAKGCAGDVFSPLLWSLVVDDLWELNNDGYYMVG